MQHWVGKTHLTPEPAERLHPPASIPARRGGTAFANTIKAEYRWQIWPLEDMREENHQ
jgi:hypothetical protein